ncbi:MAG TPA: hypothetical protein VK956_15445, partial [Verrucomicrobium sp.]|nr:hypothetical protein [Verrucomicrobium sp.]
PKQALVGFNHWDMSQVVKTQEVSNPNELSLKDISSTSPFDGAQGSNFGLITGIQLLRRGHEKLGTAVVEKSLGSQTGHPRSPFQSTANEEPVLMLARSCLAAALNDITSDKPDFADIKRRMERLLTDQPGLKSAATDGIVDGLAETTKHKSGPPGSIERIIEDYLVSKGTGGAMQPKTGEFKPAERTLILKGFEAVPALLAQRHSRRLTNHLMQGFNNFSSYPMNAGQVINAYLQSLANDDFDSNWLDRQKGQTSSDDNVLAWWKQASEAGEETYVRLNTVKGAKKDVNLSFELLLIARERFPDLIPTFYQTLLKTDEPSWPVTDALLKSNAIPQPRKIELLLAGIKTNKEAHRNTALQALQQLDPGLADEQLHRLLKKAPKTSKGEYWTDQDATLGSLVSSSSSLQVWQELHLLLSRCDLGMRMELIHTLDPSPKAPAAILGSYFAIYDRYQGSIEIRDESTSEKFSGPGAGFPHDKISMRDFLHEHWAGWLKLKLKGPENGAPAAEWESYRNAVSRAVQKYRANLK